MYQIIDDVLTQDERNEVSISLYNYFFPRTLRSFSILFTFVTDTLRPISIGKDFPSDWDHESAGPDAPGSIVSTGPTPARPPGVGEDSHRARHR